MIWPGATLSQTTARSANMSPSGASTEEKERSRSKSSGLLSPRKSNESNSFRTQQYGWRAPIDDFSALGKSRVAICKKTFFDPGHLS